jgi:hypothetical protein
MWWKPLLSVELLRHGHRSSGRRSVEYLSCRSAVIAELRQGKVYMFLHVDISTCCYIFLDVDTSPYPVATSFMSTL